MANTEIFMKRLEYIFCSGSGNRFLLFDTLRNDLSGLNLARFAAMASDALQTDGILLLTRCNDGRFGMRMFNTDGSEAGMCGNGIRCVARLVHERYAENEASFHVISGGQSYRITCEQPIFAEMPTFGVEIPVSLHNGEFAPSLAPEGFVEQPIPELDAELRFTFLRPGNPHIAAFLPAGAATLFDRRNRLRLDRLAEIGERANHARELFPCGVNVSLYTLLGENRLFAATFERGVGLTSSCGTAMTSCATAAALSGRCRFDREIEVWNRGGAVHCRPARTAEGLLTLLSGNAAFEAAGTLEVGEEGLTVIGSTPIDPPQAQQALATEIRRRMREEYGLTITDSHD